MSRYEVIVELVDLDGTTVLFDLSDGEAGFVVIDVSPGDEVVERGTSASPFVNGEFESWAKDAAQTYLVALRIKGSSWAQVEGRRLALRTAYRSATHYLLRVTFEGVTTTYRARRPDVRSGVIDGTQFVTLFRELLLTFPVQPNPTVTGVA